MQTPRSNLAPIGAAWLQSHGAGKVSSDDKDALSQSLTQELVNSGFSSATVHAEVSSFLQHGRASASNFDRLQRKLVKSTKANDGASQRPSSAAVSDFSIAATPKASRLSSPRHVRLQGVPEEPMSAREEQKAMSAPLPAPAGSQTAREKQSPDMAELARWSKIATIQKTWMEEERLQERAADQKKKMQYREFLASQMEQRNDEQKREKNEKVVLRAQVDKDKQRSNAEQEELAVQRTNKMLRLKQDIRSQVDDFYSRKEEEKISDRVQAKYENEKALAALEEEKEAAFKKKEIQKAEDMKQAKEWQEDKKKKIEVKKLEAEQKAKERQMADEAAAKAVVKDQEQLDAEAKKKQKILDDLVKMRDSAKTEKLKKRNERLEAEKASLEVVRAEAQRALELEVAKRDEAKQKRRENVEFLQQQMREKELQKTKDLKLEQLKIVESKMRTEQELEAEKRKQDEKAKHKNRYKKELIEQIETRKVAAVEGSKLKEDVLSEMEMALNKDMLAKVTKYA
mmetsp:Transcript_5710/g.10243  ORF Transcript_5710/g.10243 Transcript_5710/m.10243 type:complete len:513 (-) Transcript_5710:98-1636(-)